MAPSKFLTDVIAVYLRARGPLDPREREYLIAECNSYATIAMDHEARCARFPGLPATTHKKTPIKHATKPNAA